MTAAVGGREWCGIVSMLAPDMLNVVVGVRSPSGVDTPLCCALAWDDIVGGGGMGETAATRLQLSAGQTSGQSNFQVSVSAASADMPD